ncbi:MAG: hypothetical protein JRI23_34660, partial [Deltaproteobacteria bacterium]|nr:hypothetical protein [Deltaproteobacteria bacterium]MBW2537442.1 hypothetical protein [Deltaproteobacteria bacterium]
MSEPLQRWYDLGWPDDWPRLVALALALLLPLVMPQRLRRGRPAKRVVALASVTAAALSLAYVVVYLRGGPRIIDATSYWLQARALADGWLAWPLAEPEPATLGRFLLRTPHALGIGGMSDGPGVAVIFPPGYPALLAIGVMLGAPMAVGPALAAALVLATADLAERVEQAVVAAGLPVAEPSAGTPSWGAAPVAAVMSALCPALRYHTADTMAHGLAALCVTVAMSAALALARGGNDDESGRARPARSDRAGGFGPALVVGLAGGWLVATRPVTALALLVPLGALGRTILRRSDSASNRRAIVMGLCAGAAPGLALLAMHQLATTGGVGTSAQAAYYAVSDGPTGCFAYGFGEHVGCRGEHGTFVSHRLQGGYGLAAALGTTARRLEMHVADAFGFAPLCGLILLGAWSCRRARAARLLTLGVGAQVVCYAPFYFDG